MTRWQPGDVVLRREWLHGHLWTVFPTYVVLDTPDLLAVYLCGGSPLGYPAWPLADHQHPWQVAGNTHWTGHGKLMLHRPGDAYSVDVFWEGAERRFSGWYVNLQAPFARHATGFDTLDHELDFWWPAGADWQIKDAELLEQRIGEGRYSAELGAAIRATGRELEVLLASPWWDQAWASWQPPPAWTAPDLPTGWDQP